MKGGAWRVEEEIGRIDDGWRAEVGWCEKGIDKKRELKAMDNRRWRGTVVRQVTKMGSV